MYISITCYIFIYKCVDIYIDHKAAFLDTHSHFLPAIEKSKKSAVVLPRLQPRKSPKRLHHLRFSLLGKQ